MNSVKYGLDSPELKPRRIVICNDQCSCLSKVQLSHMKMCVPSLLIKLAGLDDFMSSWAEPDPWIVGRWWSLNFVWFQGNRLKEVEMTITWLFSSDLVFGARFQQDLNIRTRGADTLKLLTLACWLGQLKVGWKLVVSHKVSWYLHPPVHCANFE